MVVATSGPPHLTHEAGREVSELTGLPFVMDMRDPWSLAQRIPEGLASPLWLRLARRYEGAAVRRAALVVANTDAARDALAAEYPSATERLLTVMNGSDDESLPRAIAEHRFTIAYAGTIYDLDGPQSLFRAAASVIRELGLGPDDFGIDFIGADTPRQRSLIEMARAENIAEFVSVGPSRPHGEALDFLARATMLVIFPGWDVTAIPAKIFEYVRFAAWVLTLCDPGSATDRLLRGLDVDVVRPADIAAIAAGILRHYREHRRGVRPSRPVTDDRFSRRTQARILLDAIARIAPRDSDNPRRQRIPA